MQKFCKKCGNIFESTNSSKYCSKFCKNSKKCKICDKIFVSVNNKTQTCSEECRQKLIKATCLEKYGVEHAMQSEKTKEKHKNTCLEKYGVDNVSSIDFVKQKKKETCFNNFGVNYPMQSKDIMKKSIETLKIKYGVEHISKTLLFKESFKNTCLEKYGVEHNSKLKSFKDVLSNKMKIRFHKNPENISRDFFVLNFVDNHMLDLSKIMEHFECSETWVRKWVKQNLPNYNFKRRKNNPEKIIFNSIPKNIRCIINDRKVLAPKELDIYLPDYNLAVEYNGLMFHSEGAYLHPMFDKAHIHKNYHLEKTLKCEKLGIQLFHIFEGEPLDLWICMIKNKLMLNNKIYARKCSIREIDSNVLGKFLEFNHLQGPCKSEINLALIYDNKPVFVMAFNKPRNNKKYDYELIRFCSLRGFNVIGGVSKLFKYFLDNYKPKTIITFANRRFSNGDVYLKLGFKLLSISEPNYYYFKYPNLVLLKQQNLQKDKIIIFDETKSKTENIFMNGYRRIYDCGNLTFIYEND